MEIWLKQDDIKYRFPILPSEYEIINDSNNTQVNIHDLGEINLLGKRKLKNISFSSFFPSQLYSFCQYTNFINPKEAVALIEKIQNNGVLRLIMTGIITIECTIENFTWGENDGTKDINFTLDLKEYRRCKIIVKSSSTALPQKITQPVTKRATKQLKNITYIVKKGDTLTKIAKTLTGNSANWKIIYEQNQNSINNPDLIYPKQELIIKIDN